MELKKNPEADLEKKRSVFLQVGLITALAAVLLAFEYTVFDETESQLGSLNLDLLEEEIIPVTQVTPPPPPPPPVKTTIIEIVEDDEVIEEELEIVDLEVDEDTQIEIIDEPEEEVTEEEIFTIVEEMPGFPGGEAALFKFLGNNTDYPAMAADAGIQGVVYVTFVVDTEGKVKNASVLKGIGGGCDKEALRVVNSMPNWAPGRQRGKNVKVQYNLPIRFILK
jgi:protein TonB